VTTHELIRDNLPPRRTLLLSLVRIAVIVVVMLGVYALAPLQPNGEMGNWIVVAVGLLAFVVIVAWQVREVARAERPVIRALEALAIILTVFLVIFASQYVAESLETAKAFSEPLTKLAGLYYTMTVFSTVGFGDIVPVSNVARVITMIQMIGDLIVIAFAVKVLSGVATERVQLKREALNDGTPSR
jgi:voltage-gated potassium channel